MTTRSPSRWRFFVLLAALGAASFSVSFLAEAKKGRGKAPAQADDCKTDNDCATVADDCCSCTEGGKQHAIPGKQKAAYEKDRKKRCAGTACIEMMSTDPSCSRRAFCGAGICELGEAAGDGAPSPAGLH